MSVIFSDAKDLCPQLTAYENLSYEDKVHLHDRRNTENHESGKTEHNVQIWVEFIVSCEKGDFKVFINYDSNSNLYNYVIWKNS